MAARKPREGTDDLNRDQIFLVDSGPSHSVIKICICMTTDSGVPPKKLLR